MRTRHFSLFLSPLSFRNNSPISRANACTRTCYKQHNYKVKPRIKIASLREESVSRVKVNNGRRRNVEFSKWMFAFKKGKKRRGDRKQILHDKNWTLSRRMQRMQKHSRRTELKKKISVINASVLYLLAKNINLKTHLKGQDSKVGKRVVLGLLVRRKEINK